MRGRKIIAIGNRGKRNEGNETRETRETRNERIRYVIYQALEQPDHKMNDIERWRERAGRHVVTQHNVSVVFPLLTQLINNIE